MLKSFLSLAALVSIAFAATPVFAGGTNVTHDNGVVVRKNADGTVDVSDEAQGAPTSVAASGGGEVPQTIYRYNTHPGTRNIGGVKVRTNPDGSIETFDTSDSYVPVHHARSHRRAAAKRTASSRSAHH